MIINSLSFALKGLCSASCMADYYLEVPDKDTRIFTLVTSLYAIIPIAFAMKAEEKIFFILFILF